MMIKPTNFKIGLDTDAINELYTYGGEQGKKKTEEESEMEDFEISILELANQCLAAMSRSRPADPIVKDNQKIQGKTASKFYDTKFGLSLDIDNDNDEIDECEPA
jgi:hypothetical protein